MLRGVILCTISFFCAACGAVSQQPTGVATLELSISLAPPTASQTQTDSTQPNVPPADTDSYILSVEGQAPQLLSKEDASRFRQSGQTLEPNHSVTGFGTFTQGHLNVLQADALWRVSKGKGITVAVIDSGLASHPSLHGAVLEGYDFIEGSSRMQDDTGHGTAIAALIAGRGPQWGLAPQAKILPLRVLEQNAGSVYDVIQAVLFAADLLPNLSNPHKADVINLSLGLTHYSEALHDTIKQARGAGVLVVAAVGNTGQEGVAYPARYPEVIGVGAADILYGAWESAPYSSFGEGLSVLAPVGGASETAWGSYSETGIYSADMTAPTPKAFHGTSFAAPQVSAALALLLAMGLKPERAFETLLYSSVDLGSQGWDKTTGFGAFNPAAALTAAQGKLEQLTHSAYTIQVLDAGSEQELNRLWGETSQAITLLPGHYRLVVWQDANRDGLKQPNEASYDGEAFRVAAEQHLSQSIVLASP